MPSLYEVKPTGNAEWDKQEHIRYIKGKTQICIAEGADPESMKKELARLERNRERRKAREKQKRGKSLGVDIAGSPEGSATPAVEKPTGTTRKCANCGQAGHIKTNKKYCLINNPHLEVDKEEDVVHPMGITITTTKWF
jgi:hypothetical protein